MKRAISALIGLLVTSLIFFSPFPVTAQVSIDVDPMSWDFGDVELGTSVTQPFTISSTGSSNLLVFLVITTLDTIPSLYCGVNATCDYSAEGPDGLVVIPAGNSDDRWSVTFTPTALGLREAYLYIQSNADPSADQTFVPLSGTGVQHSSVPEPATMLLVGLGVVGLLGYGRKFIPDC